MTRREKQAPKEKNAAKEEPTRVCQGPHPDTSRQNVPRRQDSAPGPGGTRPRSAGPAARTLGSQERVGHAGKPATTQGQKETVSARRWGVGGGVLYK